MSDWLSLEFNYLDVRRANVNNYSKRGMAGTSKDDFKIIELGYANAFDTSIIFHFYSKRLNVYYSHTEGDFRVDAIREYNGQLIEAVNYKSSYEQDALNLELDITDDYFDPRSGFRFSVTYEDHVADNLDNAEYYKLDFNELAYVPIAQTDTLVFSFYRSDAHVRRMGNTDPAAIRAELNVN